MPGYRREGRVSQQEQSSLPKQPHMELTSEQEKPQRLLLHKSEIPEMGKTCGTCDCGKNSSLQCLLTGGCCLAGPCDLSLLHSNQKEYLPSGSRNELLQLLPCWLDGKKKTSPHGHLCFEGPQAHTIMQTRLPTQPWSLPCPCFLCISPSFCFLFQEVSVQW